MRIHDLQEDLKFYQEQAKKHTECLSSEVFDTLEKERIQELLDGDNEQIKIIEGAIKSIYDMRDKEEEIEDYYKKNPLKTNMEIRDEDYQEMIDNELSDINI